MIRFGRSYIGVADRREAIPHRDRGRPYPTREDRGNGGGPGRFPKSSKNVTDCRPIGDECDNAHLTATQRADEREYFVESR